MQKLNKKPGMTLVETICAISIISILILFLTAFQLSNLRLKNLNKDRLTYITVLEAIKEEMVSNASYNDIVNINEQNKKYVSFEKLSIHNIRSLTLEQIFSVNYKNDSSYILLNITSGDILKLELELHLKNKKTEEIISCVFYKGNYI